MPAAHLAAKLQKEFAELEVVGKVLPVPFGVR
jgi:hypothetical protein